VQVAQVEQMTLEALMVQTLYFQLLLQLVVAVVVD
jgi:hypothetical protein